MRKVPGIPRKHRLPVHRHRKLRLFRVDRRPPVEIPTPSALPWSDAVTRLSIAGGRLIVEYV